MRDFVGPIPACILVDEVIEVFTPLSEDVAVTTADWSQPPEARAAPRSQVMSTSPVILSEAARMWTLAQPTSSPDRCPSSTTSSAVSHTGT